MMFFKKICTLILVSCFTLNVAATEPATATLSVSQKASVEKLMVAFEGVIRSVPTNQMGFLGAHIMFSNFSRSINVISDELFAIYEASESEEEFTATINEFLTAASEKYTLTETQLKFINSKLEEELREMNQSAMGTTAQVAIVAGITIVSAVVFAVGGAVVGGAGYLGRFEVVGTEVVVGAGLGAFTGAVVGVVGGKVVVDYTNFAEPEPFSAKLYLPSEVESTSDLMGVAAE